MHATLILIFSPYICCFFSFFIEDDPQLYEKNALYFADIAVGQGVIG